MTACSADMTTYTIEQAPGAGGTEVIQANRIELAPAWAWKSDSSDDWWNWDKLVKMRAVEAFKKSYDFLPQFPFCPKGMQLA